LFKTGESDGVSAATWKKPSIGMQPLSTPKKVFGVSAWRRISRPAVAEWIVAAARVISQNLARQGTDRGKKMETRKRRFNIRLTECLPITLQRNILTIEGLVTNIGCAPGKILFRWIKVIPVGFGFVN
jgi:hypothetical protein